MSGVGEASAVIAACGLLMTIADKVLVYVDKKRPNRIVKKAQKVIQSKENNELFNRLIELDPELADALAGDRVRISQKVKEVADLCASGTGFWSIRIRVKWVKAASKSLKEAKKYKDRLEDASLSAEWKESERKLDAAKKSSQGISSEPDPRTTIKTVTMPDSGLVYLGNFEGNSMSSFIDLQEVLIEQFTPSKVPVPSDAQVEIIAEVQVETEDGTLKDIVTLSESLGEDSGRTSPSELSDSGCETGSTRSP